MQHAPHSDADARASAWASLDRTAASVRAAPWTSSGGDAVAERAGRRRLQALAALISCAAGGVAAMRAPLASQADSGADATLFALTNQDRASNGVRALVYNSTLATIGEGGVYTGCGFTVHGRSVDMIERDYFAHPIAGCGQLVFSIMRAYGIGYRSAGENIGWVSGESSGGMSAGYINGQFMNSPEHRANILDSSYTDLGVGSAESAPGVHWTGAGKPGYLNVWMFSEEFAQLGSAPPPPSTPRLTPRPAPRVTALPQATPPPAPAPTPRLRPPASPASPRARSTPQPTPRATPQSAPSQAVSVPLVARYDGVLPSTVESVLEAFLID